MPSAIPETGQKAARVLIVDDHPAVREGLGIRIARQSDLVVCGEAAELTEALQMMDETPPDVAIIDITLKNGNGLDLIKRIKSRFPAVRMLVWSMYDETLYAARALQAGAMGYINKEAATERIIDAIRQVLAGKVYLSAATAELVLQQSVGGQAPSTEALIGKLSERELEVFRSLGQGQDTQRIATDMGVSPKTVETYRARIKQKLNVRKNNELIRCAVQWLMKKL